MNNLIVWMGDSSQMLGGNVSVSLVNTFLSSGIKMSVRYCKCHLEC